jgi:hypothetical protein
MLKKYYIVLFVLIIFNELLNAQEKTCSDSIIYNFDIQTIKPKLKAKNYLVPLAEITALNAGVSLFDRFALNADWAKVTLHSIGDNLKHGFIWDDDKFSTNLFWHPFHGSLYFNAARSNGLDFWQSAPYGVGGSLMWEFFCEAEYPSINDLISTSFGGVALGEIAYRTTNLFLDNSATGWERFGREIAAGIVSPVNLLNRLVSGEAWRWRPADPNTRRPPFLLAFSAANRFMSDLDNNRSNFNMLVSMQLAYGERFIEDVRRPYDLFTVNMDINLLGNQPFVSNVNIVGLLWGTEWSKNQNHFLAGVFQHFDYYDSSPLKSGAKQPFEFAETASFGGGLIFGKMKKNTDEPRFVGSAYTNFVLLGASESDYYRVNRDYNLGSGYSIKLNALCNLSKHWYSSFSAKHYHFFTINSNSSESAETDDLDYARLKGSSSASRLSTISIDVGYLFNKSLKISAEQRFYFRETRYKYFDDVSTNSTENRIKLTFLLN